MPSRKKKDENAHEQTKYDLPRPPLKEGPRLPAKEGFNMYPDLSAEKENMDFSSSDDSPEKKYPYCLSPSIPVKSNSPPSLGFKHDPTNLARHRSGRHHQKQMDRFQDSDAVNFSPERRFSENSDMEFETDDFLFNYPHMQKRETSESPELDRHEYSTESRGRLKQSQSMQSSDSAQSDNLILFGILIFFIFSLWFSYNYFYGYPASSDVNGQLSAATLEKSLKSEFKDQPPLTFRIIGSALKNVLGAQPLSPAIILLLATNGSETICSDFALSLVNSLSVPKYTVKILGENYKEANANQAKIEIDNRISQTLKINQMGSVLIYDLDQIPGRAAIILHKYYDHENAPFKKAVFVMTANYNKPISDDSDTKVWDKAAYDHLLSVWTDSGVDQVTALLSRLTVSVAVITSKTL